MTVRCGYCSRTFENDKERQEHWNRIHKTEMYELTKQPKQEIFWNERYV